ncbi:MAG: DUF1848 domain-containing protein [Spirochaetaceae bacterium]|nr:DUF1848 domain-containing protein [Spirochaetaceae bacterium]
MIISASRRTDIPAFYSEWFLNRIKEGFLLVPNPRNPSHVSKVDLSPAPSVERARANKGDRGEPSLLRDSEEDASPAKIECIVFWTKNPAPLMSGLDILDKLNYLYYFEFTLTAYQNDIEKNLLDKEKIITTFKQLGSRLGPERVDWRFDPIIINNKFNIDWHKKSFYNICKQIHKYTNRCIISFVDPYSHIKRDFTEPKEDDIYKLTESLSQIAKEFDLPLFTCSEKIDLSCYGVSHCSCIDKNKIEKIIGHPINAKKDPGQRKTCGCIKSVDIGIYNTCRHGCLYCYATTSEKIVLKQTKNHNQYSPMLTGFPN